MIYTGTIGTRRRDSEEDFQAVRNTFIGLIWHKHENLTIVSGGCKKGAGRFAEMIIEEFKTHKIIHLPDKSKLDKKLLETRPRAAYAKINYARNVLVARDSKDYLIACVAEDRMGGTEHTIKEWKKYQKENNLKGKLILV